MQLSCSSSMHASTCRQAFKPASTRCTLAGLPLSARRHQHQRSRCSPAASPGQQRLASRGSTVAVQARYRGSSSPDLPERVLSALPYLLPFLDSLGYGRFLFFQYPMITRAIAPLAPLISLYSTVPFAPFVAFLGVYIGIINNQRWPRFVRFNAMQVRAPSRASPSTRLSLRSRLSAIRKIALQRGSREVLFSSEQPSENQHLKKLCFCVRAAALQAVLLDILLILPRLVEQVFSTPTGGWALQAYIVVQNTIWIFVAAAVLYGIGASLTGQTARIPLVADAAEQQVR